MSLRENEKHGWIENSRLLYSMKLTPAKQASEESFRRLRTKRDDEDRCYTPCTMSLLFRVGALVMATRQPSTSSTRGRECGSRLTDRQDIKQVCQTPGPSDVLIGDSAAPDGLLKLCGLEKVGNTRRAVAMKQRRNTGTDEGKF